MKPRIYQLNLSRGLGGAEIYTHSFSRALQYAGWDTELLVRGDARFWNDFDFGAIRVTHAGADSFVDGIPRDAIVVVHGSVPEASLEALSTRAHVIGLAHHALNEHNRFRYYEMAHWLLPVSRHVIATLERYALRRYDPHPLYGVANAERGDPSAPIAARSPYEWDSRKGRDRLLALVHPLFMRLRRPIVLARRRGLTLGIVSRISEAKQFPALFDAIAPAIAARPDVTIEIFGAGVYKQVRAVERSLGPIRSQVRFWGWQPNIAAVFSSIDYLLPGLPEREALGLNVIEAQACGVPVLAVDAGPFPETVIDTRTGYLYHDPRQDAAADFSRLLDRLRANGERPDPRRESEHLARFSFPAFAQRVDAAIHRALARFGVAAEPSVA